MEISKRNLAISLVLFGENFINNFFKYTLKTILNEKNFLNRKIKFFLISTEKKKDEYLIKKKIQKYKNIKFSVIFFIRKKNIFNKYSYISKQQKEHILFCKNNKIDYLYFIYADFIFSKNYFSYSYKKINKEKKKVLVAFAPLLVKKKLFNSFFNLILKKKSAHLKYILINKSLLHPYHYNCVVNESVLNSATSIVKFLDQKKYSYKIFHHHSVILSLKAVNKAQFYNKDFFTLDSNLLSLLNLRFKDISYEENLNYLSLFSFDDNYFERNGFYYILSTLIKNSYTLNFLSIINLNYLYFELKLFLFSTLQKKLFTKITYSNKKNDKNNIFFKKHIFIINQLKYKKNKLLHFIKTLNNIIPGKINLKDFSLFFIFLIFIFFIRFFNKFLVLNLKSCKFIFNTVINSKTIKQMFYLIIIYNYILKKCTK